MKKPRKLRIRGYKGESSPIRTYGDWVDARGGIEHIPPEQEWEGSQPWSIRASTDLEIDQMEALEKLVPTLKGRQRQIIALLMEGVLNQSEIGRRLGIHQSNVAYHLRCVEKKIKKLCIGMG